jgi:hypothetical protein
MQTTTVRRRPGRTPAIVRVTTRLSAVAAIDE